MSSVVRPAGQFFQCVQVVSDIAVCSNQHFFFLCYISADSKHLRERKKRPVCEGQWLRWSSVMNNYPHPLHQRTTPSASSTTGHTSHIMIASEKKNRLQHQLQPSIHISVFPSLYSSAHPLHCLSVHPYTRPYGCRSVHTQLAKNIIKFPFFVSSQILCRQFSSIVLYITVLSVYLFVF